MLGEVAAAEDDRSSFLEREGSRKAKANSVGVRNPHNLNWRTCSVQPDREGVSLLRLYRVSDGVPTQLQSQHPLRPV